MKESELILAAVTRWYPPRRFAVCDRVSWGFDLSYEADAIAIGDGGLCDELEAKSSLSDLRADLDKQKWKLIAEGLRKPFPDRFWYVVPEKLRDAAVEQARPRGFGVVVVHPPEAGYSIGRAERVLPANRLHPNSRERRQKFIEKRGELWRLAGLRYWDELKTRLRNGYANNHSGVEERTNE